MHQFEFGLFERFADRSQVDGLTAGHAARAAGVGEQGDHFELALTERLAGQQFEGQCLQAVADQQRGRFVVFNVAGRPAAAQHVVVHARQVVVHQRVGVDQLDRAGDDIEFVRGGAGQFAGGEGEQRPHTLAAAECGVAHGLVQALRDHLAGRQEAAQGGFGAGLGGGHPVSKRNAHCASRVLRSISRASPFSMMRICSSARSSCA